MSNEAPPHDPVLDHGESCPPRVYYQGGEQFFSLSSAVIIGTTALVRAVEADSVLLIKQPIGLS